MLVNVEDSSMKCWSPNPVPRIIYLQIVANNKRLGTQLCIDLMADAGIVLGEDGEPTDVRR
jgi:hypothetical protein